jgi:hypothetical protein
MARHNQAAALVCSAPPHACTIEHRALRTYVVETHWPVIFRSDGVDAAIARSALHGFDGRLNFRVLAYVMPDGAQFSTVTDQLPDFVKAPATVR